MKKSKMSEGGEYKRQLLRYLYKQLSIMEKQGRKSLGYEECVYDVERFVEMREEKLDMENSLCINKNSH